MRTIVHERIKSTTAKSGGLFPLCKQRQNDRRSDAVFWCVHLLLIRSVLSDSCGSVMGILRWSGEERASVCCRHPNNDSVHNGTIDDLARVRPEKAEGRKIQLRSYPGGNHSIYTHRHRSNYLDHRVADQLPT